ncbi:protein asteroid homolog 1-like isoform X3 [Gadus macrocephalus]|uniref:protein asteroid homolog 1-like isoform X3 n=1 Tax=Gadus macrocephalus TaxID=80720 RepID=UPI0028CB6908|nr:protein asteroid homolog 1-like isoform X3 [Gadus macrocephalus]
MGVKGLSSLLEDNRRISPDIHFRDSKLVADGNNLLYLLYFSSNLDQNHGGECLAFHVEVQAFFKTLADCGIKPYVVMDGGSGTSDIKLDTIMDRARGKVQKTHDAALTGRKGHILPALTKHVFRQTLNDLKVPLVQCFGEADGRLAALAREWCCPVLSADSDFYIFDLPDGLLHLDHFQWRAAETRRGIPCRRYLMSRFCTFFNIDPQLLPVFASLAGNDYVNLRDVKWARYLPAGSPKMKFSAANLVGLLSWLRARTDRTTEDTLTAVMKLMPSMSQQAQTEVRTMLRKSMLEYELPSSSLRGFFSEGTIPLLPAELLSCVPDWVRTALARGELNSDVLGLLVHRLVHKLRTQVEPSDLQSSNLTSKHIRQVWYGLLLGQRGGEMEELDRVGLELASFQVRPLVQGAAQTLRLDSLPQADPAVRLQVCLETLGVEEETLEGVPAHLRLPVAVTRYWLRRASPEPRLLKALLMVMVQGELNRRKGGTTDWQGDTRHLSKPLDGVVAHSLNQWQACLKDASQLNLLLCKPLPEPLYAWLYQGRLVHQRQEQLQEREPEDIVQDDQFISLYRRLLGAVTQPDPGANRRAGGPEGQHGAPSPQHPG